MSPWRSFRLGILRKSLERYPGFEVDRSVHGDWRRLTMNPTHQLSISAGVILEGPWQILFERDGASVRIGPDVFFGASRVLCAESIEIGEGTFISWGCTLMDHDAHSVDWRDRMEDLRVLRGQGAKKWEVVPKGRIHIGRRAWLGFGVTVLKGVSIGEGSVVGAQSVVTRDIPPRCLAAGNPARIIRKLKP